MITHQTAPQVAPKTPEEILFEKNALEIMAKGFSFRGFKRTYPTLLRAIVKTMKDWADPVDKRLQEEQKKTAVVARNLALVSDELKKPHPDHQAILELTNQTLLLIK